jgi:hypothetical protein
MKRIITVLVFLTTSLFYAQTTGITYQAVIYNPAGEILPGNNDQNAVLANKDICLRFSIKDAATNLEYQETQKVKTDEFGMVNVVIGQGNQVSGYARNFDAILWNSTTKKLQVEMDTTGNCSIFIEVSNQNFSAVPFAYASKTAENVSGIVAIANGGTGATTVSGAKTNLGLNNVDNTSDANKPISTATQAALDTKAPLASPALTGTPTVPTAANGTNTNQIASTAFVQSAITAAATPDATATVKGKLQLTGDLGGTADAPTVPGLANKENTIAAGTNSQYYRGDKSWQTLDKTAVGLGNVNNTTDADKPVSTATQTALNTKENTIAAGTNSQYYRGDKSWQTLDKTAVGLGNVNNTADADKPVSTATQTALAAKEPAANKSTNPTLGISDDLFPTQKAVKTYVDNQINAGVVDATATVKGKLRLAGDLGGTADAPLVPELEFKAPLDSPQFIGTPSLPSGTVAVTQAANNNSTAVATTAYVNNALSSANSNARSSDLDMDGNAILNTSNARMGQLFIFDENANPFFGGTDDNAVTILNRQNNVTHFLDGRTGSPILAITNSINETDTFGTPTLEEGKIGIGTTTPSEKLQVIGNIKSQSFIKDNGTAAQFLKADGSVDNNTYLTTTLATGTYEPKITAGTTTQYFRGDKSWQTLDKTVIGLGNVDNTSDANKPISTATQAALDFKAPLASPTLTGTPVAPTASAGTNTTQIATTAFVTTAVGAVTIADASNTVKGKIQLAGDLGGSNDATNPTISTGAISTAKLADNAVTTDKISNANVTTAKLADNAVTNAKLGEIVSVNKGGTGATSLTGYLKGNGTSAFTTESTIPVANVDGAVSSVNGVTPVNGNVSVLIGNVYTGNLITPTTGSTPVRSDIYIVAGQTGTPNDNGRTFIYDGTTWHEISTNIAALDNTFVKLSGSTMTGNLVFPASKKITIADVPTGGTDVANKNYVDGLANGKQNTITLTTSGTGAATLTGATLNIPTPNNGTVTEVSALTLGTSGTDITSTVATATTTPVVTLNVPTASAANRGALSAADWSTFNNKVGGNGTTNFVPKFSGTTPSKTVTDSSIFDDGVNVGIKTTSPTSTLHIENPLSATNTVNATAKVLTLSRPNTSNIKWGNIAQFNLGSYAVASANTDAANTRLDLDLNDGSGITTSNVMTWQANGNVGIGTTAPTNKLEIKQGTAGNSGLRFTNLNSSSLATTSASKVLGLNSTGDVILTNIPGTQNIVTFSTATPTTSGVVFTPDTPTDQSVVYQSVLDNSLWAYNGTAYVTYTAPASTAWNLANTTNDAGKNKTSSIWRSGGLISGGTSTSKVFGNLTAYGGTDFSGGVPYGTASIGLISNTTAGWTGSGFLFGNSTSGSNAFTATINNDKIYQAWLTPANTYNLTSMGNATGWMFGSNINSGLSPTYALEARGVLASTSNAYFGTGGSSKVGINTTAPATTLHMNSNIISTNTINVDGQMLRMMRPQNPGVKWENIAQFNLGSYAVTTGGSTNATSRLDLAMNDGDGVATSNVMTWQANGNVGIGTTSPISSLTNAPSGTNFVSSNSATQSTTGISWLTNTAGYNTSLYNSNNVVGSNGLQVKVANNSNQTIALEVGQNTTQTGISTPLFNVLGNGNVGIGTSAPLTKLIVNDNAFIANLPTTTANLMDNTTFRPLTRFQTTSGINNNALSIYDTTTAFSLQAHNYSTGAALTLNLQTAGGSIGIGTTTPYSQLANTASTIQGSVISSVNGGFNWVSPGSGFAHSVYSSNSIGGGAQVKVAGNTSNVYAFEVSQATTQTGITTPLFNVIGNGNVGVGTNSPAAQLHTTGSIRFAGAGTPGVGKILTSDASGNATWQSTAIATKTADYTLTANDYGSVLVFNSASTVVLTIPSSLSAGFYCQVIQQGTGQVNVVGASGVTVASALGSNTRTTGSSIGILLTTGTSAFLSGDTSF